VPRALLGQLSRRPRHPLGDVGQRTAGNHDPQHGVGGREVTARHLGDEGAVELGADPSRPTGVGPRGSSRNDPASVARESG
jgi:hypothetical protein